MMKSRRQELSKKFTEQWQRCRNWLPPFMQNNQPTFLTKDELRSAAMREQRLRGAPQVLLFESDHGFQLAHCCKKVRSVSCVTSIAMSTGDPH
jgi:hypothetical protein